MNPNYQTHTIAHYDTNAQRFSERSLGIDMQQDYERFIKHLPAGALILDAGCGAGRDIKYFKSQGFEVDAFDASAELVAIATRVAKQPVRNSTFAKLSDKARFDGIWASASLLHLNETDLTEALQKLWCALKPGGHMFMSFKYGEGEASSEGRYFLYQTEQTLRARIADLANAKIVELWQSAPRGMLTQTSQWIQVIVTKA